MTSEYGGSRFTGLRCHDQLTLWYNRTVLGQDNHAEFGTCCSSIDVDRAVVDGLPLCNTDTGTYFHRNPAPDRYAAPDGHADACAQLSAAKPFGRMDGARSI
jgi:hypothetical protein